MEEIHLAQNNAIGGLYVHERWGWIRTCPSSCPAGRTLGIRQSPLKPVKTGKHSLKWTSELQSLRREVRRLFIKCRADRTPQSWVLYTEAQRRCRKDVRNTSKDARRTFCSSVNDLHMSVRLHRAISSEPNIKLGSLVAPSWRRMQSEGQTWELLLVTHFPNSVVTEEVAAPAAARCDMFWLTGGCEGCHLWYLNGQLILLPYTKD